MAPLGNGAGRIFEGRGDMSKAKAQPAHYVISSLDQFTLCAAFANGFAQWEPSAMDGEPGTLTIGGQTFATTLDKFGTPKLDVGSLAALKETMRENGWADS